MTMIRCQMQSNSAAMVRFWRCSAIGLLMVYSVCARAAQTGDTELSRLLECALPLGQGVAQQLEVELTEQLDGQPATHLYALIDLRVEQDDRRMRVRMSGPPEVAGSTYLLIQRDGVREMHMYLPALERSRELGPDSRIQLMGTGFEVRSLFGLLLGGESPAVTSGRRVNRDGRSVRKVHVTGLAGDGQSTMTTLWIDSQSCQTIQVDFSGRAVMTLHYAGQAAQWPQSLRIEPDGMRGASELRIVERRPLSPNVPLTPQAYYR